MAQEIDRSVSGRVLEIPEGIRPGSLLLLVNRKVERVPPDAGRVLVPVGGLLRLEVKSLADLDLIPAFPADAIQSVYLSNPKLDDRTLARLTALTGLREILAFGTRISDAGLAHVSGLTSLQWLIVGKTRVSDEGLIHLAGLKLMRLFLSNTKVSDAGLEHVAQISSLQVLALDGTRVTDAGMKHLAKLRSLRSLSLSGTGITDAGVERLENLVDLRVLVLMSTGVRGHGVMNLARDLEVALPRETQERDLVDLARHRPDLTLGGRRFLPDGGPLYDKPVLTDGSSFEFLTPSKLGEPDQSDLPVLLEFSADWCVPCRWQEPHIRSAAVELEGKVLVAKVDVQKSPNLAEHYRVRSLPTLLLLVEERERLRLSGSRNREAIVREVLNALSD